MSEIQSPLGSRRVSLTSPPQRVFTVPDAETEENIQEEMEELERLREVKAQSQRITPTAKQRIEILTGIGRLTEDVLIDGITFTLQSLKSGEMREIVKLSSSASANATSVTAGTTESYFESRIQTLARSIVKIDQQPIDTVLGSDKLEAKIHLIEEMDENVVEFLHAHYLTMVKKNQDKYTIKDEKEAKEVSELIKK